MIAWSTFNDPPPNNSRFGRSPDSDTTGAGFPAGPSYEVLCSNPASLGANERKPLTSYLRSEPFPGVIGALLVETYGGPPPSAPTPWLQPSEHYTGRCEQSAGANVLMLRSIGSARKLNPAPDPSWGLHITDANIALGELVDERAPGGSSLRARPHAASADRGAPRACVGQAPAQADDCLPGRLRRGVRRTGAPARPGGRGSGSAAGATRCAAAHAGGYRCVSRAGRWRCCGAGVRAAWRRT